LTATARAVWELVLTLGEGGSGESPGAWARLTWGLRLTPAQWRHPEHNAKVAGQCQVCSATGGCAWGLRLTAAPWCHPEHHARVASRSQASS
jgi:hypothetical protein